ncbi:MAG: hypothetical protein ABGZ17_09675, partial [Planctomycetaceae bacterium]
TVLGDEPPTVAFDPTEVPPINATDSTIRIARHGYETGQTVRYLSGGGTPIPGLANGTEYAVIAVDANHFQLAVDQAAAATGQFQTISDGATGDDHSFESPQAFTVSDPPIVGLRSGQAYYAVVDGLNALRLVETAGEVELAQAIPFTVDSEYQDKQATLNATTGVVIEATTASAKNQSLAGAGLGGSPNVSDLLTKPEVTFNRKSWQTAWGGLSTPLSQGTGGSGLSAAVAWTDVDHTILVNVNGTVETTGDLTISASHAQNSKLIAKGSASGGKGNTFSLAVGFAYGDISNTVVVDVGGEARLDAGGVLNVQSSLKYPRLKYPTVKDGVATSGHTNKDNPANWPPTIAKWISPTLGVDSFLNVWTNSVIFKPDKGLATDGDKYNTRATTAITGSVAYVAYDNDSQAIVRDGARINQKPSRQTDEQTVSVTAATSMTLIGLSGSIQVNILKGLFSFNLGTAFSLYGTKSKSLSMGASFIDVVTDNTTLALIESATLIRTGSNGRLTVKSTEDIRKNVFAESGSESDGVGIGASSADTQQGSTTIANVARGVIADGGELDVTASSDIRHIVVSGSLVSGGSGIGLSGSVIDVTRDTGAFIGDVTQNLQREYTVYGTDATTPPPSTSSGRIQATGIDVSATNSGDLYNYSVVGVTPTFRSSFNSVGQTVGEGSGGEQPSFKSADDRVVKDVENKFHLAFAGDAAVNVIGDTTLGHIDAALFASISADSSTNPSDADVSVTSQNTTVSSAASGAGAIASGQRDGSGAAVAGSAAVNIITQTTTAQITDTSQPLVNGSTPQTVHADGDITVQAQAGAAFDSGLSGDASTWAVSGSLGYAASGGFTNTGALSTSWIDLTGSTIASIDEVRLTAGTPGNADSGAVTVSANSQHKITGDGGAVAIAREKRSEEGSSAEALGFGGSYAYNDLDYSAEALLSNQVDVVANSLTITATDASEITSMTIAGAIEAGASEVALSLSASGSTNRITRKVRARIANSDGSRSLPSTTGIVDVNGDLHVIAIDTSAITAISGGVAFTADTKLDSVFSGLAGASWSTNEITTDSELTALVEGVQIEDTPGNITIQANEQASIESTSVQLGVLGSLGDGATVNVAGAIAWNLIDGQVSADLSQSIVAGCASLTVSALSSGTVHSQTIALTLEMSLAVANIGVGINVTTSEMLASLSASIANSEVSSTGSVDVLASSTRDISSTSANAAVQLGISQGVSVGVNYLGVWSTNIVRGTVEANLASSRVHASSAIQIAATDDGDIDALGVGVQVVLTVSDDASIDVGAITQFADNDVASAVTAGITQCNTVNATGGVAVTSNKTTTLDSQLYTIAVGFAGSGGISIDASAATTVLDNSIADDDASGALSLTHARIDSSDVTAGAVDVSATSTPLIYAKIWDIDAQAAVASSASFAGVFGEAKVVSQLADDVQAVVEDNSSVTSETGPITVAATLNLPQSTDMPNAAPA